MFDDDPEVVAGLAVQRDGFFAGQFRNSAVTGVRCRNNWYELPHRHGTLCAALRAEYLLLLLLPACKHLFSEPLKLQQGVDFGKYTQARVEKIRWHPLYDFLEDGIELKA